MSTRASIALYARLDAAQRDHPDEPIDIIGAQVVDNTNAADYREILVGLAAEVTDRLRIGWHDIPAP